MKHFSHYPLQKHNTFGFSVQCADFYQYDQKEDLQQLYSQGVFNGKWLPIGGGSNLLLLNDLDYAVIHSQINFIRIEKETDDRVWVRAGAGVIWDDFVQWSVENQLGGIENLSFIPGTVGASPVQNIGAYGVEAKDVIREVEVYDTKENRFYSMDAASCRFEYRGSIFKELKHLIVVSVVYELATKNYSLKLDYGNVREVMKEKGDESLSTVRNAIIEIRKSKLPLPEEIGSAGSFFKNPVVDAPLFQSIFEKYPSMPYYSLEEGYKIPAAWLISQCGWKGKSIDAAGVYEKQPLILVNRGGATGADILFLMHQIQLSVKDKFNILLHPEVCLVE